MLEPNYPKSRWQLFGIFLFLLLLLLDICCNVPTPSFFSTTDVSSECSVAVPLRFHFFPESGVGSSIAVRPVLSISLSHFATHRRLSHRWWRSYLARWPVLSCPAILSTLNPHSIECPRNSSKNLPQGRRTQSNLKCADSRYPKYTYLHNLLAWNRAPSPNQPLAQCAHRKIKFITTIRASAPHALLQVPRPQ